MPFLNRQSSDPTRSATACKRLDGSFNTCFRNVLTPRISCSHSAKVDKGSENLNSQKASPPSNQHFNGESTLTRRQEQLASKYGGSARASRAASKIQQTFRQYSLNRNFEKLRQEVENTRSGDRRLKLRRFNKNEEHADDQQATVSDIVDKSVGFLFYFVAILKLI